MDIAVWLQALILGVIEGLTEFLPVSSTGHLILAGDLLGFNDDKGKLFEVVIQSGAILAVCWEYRAKILSVVGGLHHDPSARRFVLNLFVAFLPFALLGFLFGKTVKLYLFNPLTVALAFIVGGLVILWVERREHVVRIESVDDLNWKDALKLGCMQTLAMIPGTSRSGATIIGGLFFGLSRKAATEFSFFLAIPTLFAATAYELYKARDLLALDDLAHFSIGFIAAFFSAFIAVRGLIRYVAHHDFSAFAWYRIVFGIAVLTTAYTGLVSWSA
ncbi:undecaprenyl-diphosphate phosphatase [Candidatus Methylospira mobilis]|uniref:Undecaprenyl-diphosphatase n=1 Tax=Candidatus Methylospira mobilis TaxID=1808979 RepID=A0A5Q0BK37_9GAMM|nr:undecaprenyl-diphosphate phosphatase [Candidatus Methylospira mobilis]QFY44173.1 undecaprenyl-diphosphate phosphatase [Candidatus Methylospira mobilis]WNV06405.1 undecaprenyl-diphosphate phosphatase [Candidatus Methylospira mobilis]